jgi:hypothetical protein
MIDSFIFMVYDTSILYDIQTYDRMPLVLHCALRTVHSLYGSTVLQDSWPSRHPSKQIQMNYVQQE